MQYTGFFHKIFGGGLVFRDDFRSPSGMELDGGTWKNCLLRPNIPPYSKIIANLMF